ncbi:MAG: hypothetical protein F9K27_07750 [Anaerolineae bacterium]|nr:MAG: hypothetical protein F9K27_07750 [Anaerolineae bacterium]
MEQIIPSCRTAQQKAVHGTAMPVAASRRCDFARRGWGVGIQIDLLPAASQLNTLAPHAPEGWMQRLSPLHECGGAEMPPHSWTRFAAPTERTREPDAFPIRITPVQPILVFIRALQPDGNECKTGEA